MSENTRRALVLFTAFAILFSMMPVMSGAQEETAVQSETIMPTEATAGMLPDATEPVVDGTEYTSPDTTESATESETTVQVDAIPLELDVYQGVNIAQGGQMAYFSFTPVESGTYYFSSSMNNGADTYGHLYDAQLNEISCDDDSGGDMNFKITCSLTTGITYYFGARFLNSEMMGSFSVRLEKMPVLQSLVFTPVSVMENTNGHWSTGYDPTMQYWYYEPSNLLQNATYTATFQNGDVISGSGTSMEYRGQWYYFSATGNQSYENQWTAGNTYTVDVSVLGVTAQVAVTIEESPLESLVFTPVSVIEGTDGYKATGYNPETGNHDLQYWHYNSSSLLWQSTYTATFKNGDVRTGCDSGFTYDGTYYSFTCTDNQSAQNQWLVGNTYTIDVSVLGVTAQLAVTIEESPLESLVFTPVEVTEYTCGYMSNGYDSQTGMNVEYWYYSPWSILERTTCTITFRDGTVRTVNADEGVEYNGQWYSFSTSYDQNYENRWTAGNTYPIYATMLGVTAQLPVTITESPVAGITADPLTVEEHKSGYWTWGENGEYFRYEGWMGKLTYTVSLRDGTTFSTMGSSFTYEGQTYSLSGSDNQSTNPWLVGNTYEATVKVLGQSYPVYVTVAAKTEDNGYEYLVQNGEVIICGCTLTTEILQIPETIDGYPVVGITSLGDAPRYAKELRIPDSVRMLSSMVFYIHGSTYALEKLVLGSGISVLNAEILGNVPLLESIEVSEENPWLCSVDGVLYDKALTTMLAFPKNKTDFHQVPDSVTNLDWYFDSNFGNTANGGIQFGDQVEDYKMVDGIIYNADMTKMIKATSSATGSYTMPESVTEIAPYAFQNSQLTDVRISPKVTNLVYTMFMGFNALESIGIPASIETIGSMTFESMNTPNLQQVHIEDLSAWCGVNFGSNPLWVAGDLYLNGEKITDLVIPEQVSSISESAFVGGSFESVTIPTSVTRIGYNAFANCQSLQGVYITDLAAWCAISFEDAEANPLYCAKNLYVNGELVTDLQIPQISRVNPFAFYNGSMTSLSVPATVTDISYYAFAGTSIAQVSLPEGITSIGYSAFENSALQSLELPDSLSRVSDRTFAGCKALKSVDFGSGVTTIGMSSFNGCGLEAVTFPSQVSSIGTGAFANSSLREVVFDCDEVRIAGGAFQNCPIGELELGENVKEIGDYGFYSIEAPILRIPATVTAISYRTFAFNENLVCVTIPDTVEYILSTAFQGDDNLSHVLYTGTQDQWNALMNEALKQDSPALVNATLHCEAVGDEVSDVQMNCTTIRFYCSICDKYETVTRSKSNHTYADGVCTVCGHEGYWDYVVDEETGTVTITAYLGTDTDVVIPDKIEGLPVTNIAKQTFRNNDTLTSVTVPGTVKEICDEAFYGCESLRHVTLQEGVVSIGNEAFRGCSLQTIELPSTLTYIGTGAFYSCNLIDLTLPEGLQYIGVMAFAHCGRLKQIDLPDTVTQIGYQAFCYCWNLEQVELPEELQTVEFGVLSGTQISEITVPANVHYVDEMAFSSCEELDTVIFQSDAPECLPCFSTKVTGFYDPATEGWDALLESYEGMIQWYPSSGPVIQTQPEGVTVESGQPFTLSVEAYGHRLSYQWWYALHGESTFSPIGGNSFELSMSLDENLPAADVYCLVTDVLGNSVTTQTVIVQLPAMPSGLSITQLPYTVEYALRQPLRTEGLQVMLDFTDGSQIPVSDYILSGYDSNVSGTQVITVSYKDYLAYFTVTVSDDRFSFTDADQGIEISAPKDALDSDTQLVTEQVTLEQTLPEIFLNKLMQAFDIILEKNGEHVQPAKPVKVSIPVPKHMQGASCRVFYVDEQGNFQDMQARLVGRFLEFVTDHFSVYTVVEFPSYSVSGSVQMPEGTQGATVSLLQNDQVLYTVHTTDGKYSIDAVIDGTYTVQVNADGGPARSYDLTVAGEPVTLNMSVVMHTVTFQDWNQQVISQQQIFAGMLVTAPEDPVRADDLTYSYTFAGWDKQLTVCTEDTVYTALYHAEYLNRGGSMIVGNATAHVGEQFTLPVTVTDNVGIAGIVHSITFDATALMLVGVEFCGDYAEGTAIINDQKASEGLLTVLWFHSDNVTTNGVVYEMTFEVLETATDTTVDVTIDYLENGNANLEGENVIFDPINGSVETMTYYLGDLNSDGQVTMVDLLKLAQYVAKFEIELTDTEYLAADVTGDGAVDIHDVILLNQWLLEEDA